MQLCLAHGDSARAKGFAELAYDTSVATEGDDKTISVVLEGWVNRRCVNHQSYVLSQHWKQSVRIPQGSCPEDYVRWLWRRTLPN